MLSAQTISVFISRPVGVVYDFLAEPTYIPRWSGFVTGMEAVGDDWVATTSAGRVTMRFEPRNALGVVDHTVTTGDGTEVYVPLRVVANGDGSEVLFTVFRQPGMDDAAFEKDVGMVRADLDTLKRVLESG